MTEERKIDRSTSAAAYNLAAMIRCPWMTIDNDNWGPDPDTLPSVVSMLRIAEKLAGDVIEGAEGLERQLPTETDEAA